MDHERHVYPARVVRSRATELQTSKINTITIYDSGATTSSQEKRNAKFFADSVRERHGAASVSRATGADGSAWPRRRRRRSRRRQQITFDDPTLDTIQFVDMPLAVEEQLRAALVLFVAEQGTRKSEPLVSSGRPVEESGARPAVL